MEVYILDGLLRRTAIVDVFESLIWTDRQKEIGDFELKVLSTPGNQNLFPTGTRLAINESFCVMTVETVEDITDSDGRKILSLKGRSLEYILDDRILFQTFAGYNRAPWTIQSLTPGAAVRQMFQSICVEGVVHPSDIIPLVLTNQSLYPTPTIAEPTELITETLPPKPLYRAFKEVLDPYEMGVRLYRDPNTGRLHFDVYTGSDRTSRQTTLPPVIFSPALGNLQNTNSLKTIEKSKNVAYVWYEALGYSVTVYQDNSGPEVDGLDRRALLVEVTSLPEGMEAPVFDVSDPETFDYELNDQRILELDAYLTRVGKESLVNARAFMAFDGEIDQNSEYKYGIHYFLGDLVEQRSSDGAANYMRVTEQIFSSDVNGDKSYPTLEKELYVSAGAWGSWRYNKAWVEMADTETWANQPD